MSYSSEVLADSPWGFWRQQETSIATSAADSGSNGVAFALGELATLGKSPLLADGGHSAAGSGSAVIATLSSVPASLVGANVTLEAWVNIPAGNVSGAFVKVGTSSNGWGMGVGGSQWVDLGKKLILLSETKAWHPTTHTFTTGIHHVMVVRGAAGAVTAYVDGVSVWSGTLSAPVDASGVIGVGGVTPAAYGPLSSTVDVDNVAIFAGALSSSRVTAHYNGGTGDNTALAADSPVIWLKLDEAGNTFADSSGNARSLYATGSPTANQSGPVSGGKAVSWPAAAGYARTAATMTQPTVGTIEAWVYLAANPASETYIAAPAPVSGDSGSTMGLTVRSDGKATFTYYNGSGVAIVSPSALTLGTWHHIVGSVGAAGTRLRIDKTTVATNSHTAVSSLATSAFWVRGSYLAAGAGALVVAEPVFFPTQLSDARTDAHFDAAAAASITIAGEFWASPSAMLDGLAKLGLRVAGESWPTAATMLDGAIPVTTPVVVSGDSWTAPATMFDGTPTLGPLVVTGESWSVSAEWAEGFFPGQPVVVAGQAWAAAVVWRDGQLVVDTDLTFDNDGYNYTGLARVFYDPPVAEPPAHVRRTKVRQVHQSMPAPTLVDGRPT